MPKNWQALTRMLSIFPTLFHLKITDLLQISKLTNRRMQFFREKTPNILQRKQSTMLEIPKIWGGASTREDLPPFTVVSQKQKCKQTKPQCFPRRSTLVCGKYVTTEAQKKGGKTKCWLEHKGNKQESVNEGGWEQRQLTAFGVGFQ